MKCHKGVERCSFNSGDSWMYPYQRTHMGNPYISPILVILVGTYGL